jgi:hypothetical protein
MNTCLDALKTAQEIHDQTPVLLSRLYLVKCKLLKSENRDLYIENPDWSKLRSKLEKKFPLCPDLNRVGIFTLNLILFSYLYLLRF